MCDIDIGRLSEYIHVCLQQQDPSRLKAVAVVTATTFVVAGLSYLGLGLSRRRTSAEVESSHSDVNCDAAEAFIRRDNERADTLKMYACMDAGGQPAKLESSACPVCSDQVSFDTRCRDCLQTCYCSESCLNLHWRTHQAACTRLVHSIDHALMSYLFGSSADALGKCDAALGRFCLGQGNDSVTSTPATRPLLLDLRGLIHAQQRDRIRAVSSFQLALQMLTKAMKTSNAQTNVSKYDLASLDTQGYLAPTDALCQSDFHHLKAQILLHLNLVRLTFEPEGAEAGDLAFRACQQASKASSDTLHAIAFPLWAKVALNQSMCVRLPLRVMCI